MGREKEKPFGPFVLRYLPPTVLVFFPGREEMQWGKENLSLADKSISDIHVSARKLGSKLCLSLMRKEQKE